MSRVKNNEFFSLHECFRCYRGNRLAWNMIKFKRAAQMAMRSGPKTNSGFLNGNNSVMS